MIGAVRQLELPAAPFEPHLDIDRLEAGWMDTAYGLGLNRSVGLLLWLMSKSSIRLAEAKRRYSAACEAFLRGDADAVERCERALPELTAARREQEQRHRLRAVNARSGGR